MDWLDLLAVQGTLKSLLQQHSSKASILWHSAFFMVQLSHPYMTTGKTIALTSQTFVGKVMSLFLNMLSRFVIGFLPRSKCLLISWLHSPCAVILEPKKINSVTVSIVPPSICHEMMGPDVMIFIFWISIRTNWNQSNWLEPVSCSLSGSNCCFLICIQVSQEAGKVIRYSHLFKNFPQFVVIHIVKGFGLVSKAETDFFWNCLAFWWSNRCWQFDLWFLCLF